MSLVNRAVALLGAAAVLGAVVVSGRPPPLVPLSSAPLAGVAIEVSAVTATGSTGPGVRPIVATYHLDTTDPDPRISVAGVTGPFIQTSTVRAAPADVGPYDAVTVTATPDCSSVASLDAGPAPYELTIAERDAHGRSARGRLGQTDPAVDWDSAVRRDCWQAFAQQSLTVEQVRPTLQPSARRVDLDVLLRNGSDRGVTVQVLDIADVATIDAADSGVVPAGAGRWLRVRLPIRDCSSPVLPLTAIEPSAGAAGDAVGAQPALAWSIGPEGTDPLALLNTGLSSPQAALVRDAVLRLCRPPATTVSVTGATVRRAADDQLGPSGVSIAVQLSVHSAVGRLLLGYDQTGLTADARVPTTQATVTLLGRRGRATVVWYPSCTDRVPPVLPVMIPPTGRYAVVLRDPLLAEAYTAACRLDRLTDPTSARRDPQARSRRRQAVVSATLRSTSATR
jgi:hypothetical protein